MKFSDQSKRFANRAFDYVDDNNNGYIEPSELLVAMRTADKYSYIG